MSFTQEEYNRGKQALTIFHLEAKKLYPSVYKISIDELEKILTSRTGQKFFVQGLGMGTEDVSFHNVQEGMKALAREGKGKIPANNNSFYQAIANNVRDNISYVDASLFVAKESAKDIAEGAQAVGDSVISAGKFLSDNLWIIPLVSILVGGGYVYIFSKNVSKA